MDVGDWLRSLGLGQYESLFRQNDIDAEVLNELTEGDLEKFGVSFGHRKRLLKAIANLGAAEAPAKPTIPPPTASSRDVAERRPITVMFCDLVGSTSLAARLDAEDWRNLVGSYLDAASAAVTSLGGHVLWIDRSQRRRIVHVELRSSPDPSRLCPFAWNWTASSLERHCPEIEGLVNLSLR
jgi:SAM domain (Sterile alpha motif)